MLKALDRRVVFMVLACMFLLAGAAAGQTPENGSGDESIVLEPLLLGPDGAEAVFYIEEYFAQTVLEADGFFARTHPYAAEQSSLASVVVHYAALEPDPSDPRPRVLVHAVAYDPEFGEFMDGLRWRATYAFTDDGAVRTEGDVVPEEFENVVSPDWLVNWFLVAPDDVPSGSVRPGDRWAGASNLDIDDFMGMFESFDVSAEGQFEGWLAEPDRPEGVALIRENVSGRASGVIELTDGFHAPVDFDVNGRQEYRLVPGAFPAGMSGIVTGTMRFVVGPESGAPSGAEGSLDVSTHYEVYIERMADDTFPWRAFDETAGEPESGAGFFGALAGHEFNALTADKPAAGVLGAWSDGLPDGTYADFYEFVGEAGARAALEMRSEEFDAYLFLLDREGNVLASDDDGAGESDARIEYTLPYSGSYIVVANAFSPREAGLYTLSLTWADPLHADVQRAVELLGMLQEGLPLDDDESAELEALLERLLQYVRIQR